MVPRMRNQALLFLLSVSSFSSLSCATSPDLGLDDTAMMDMNKPPEPSCRTGQVAKLGDNFFEDISDKSGIRAANYTPMPPMTIPINDHSRLAFADLDRGRLRRHRDAQPVSQPPERGFRSSTLVFLNNRRRHLPGRQ
jgi:hypothetical protein